MIIQKLILIINFIFLLCDIFLFYKVNQIKINKNEEYQKQYENYLKLKNNLKEEVNELLIYRDNLINSFDQKKEQLNKNILLFQQQRTKEINNYIENKKELANKSIQEQQSLAKETIIKINYNLETFKSLAQQQKQQIQNEINKLKASLSAGVEARLREQEKKEKINFYRLIVQGTDSEDIQKLQNLKLSFHNSTILSKLIWTQYFQKQMTQLCDRILGKKTICGIYKITNILTEQCYIGQSVDIAKRWKDHCKCGLGIDTPSTNKLYQAMQKDKIWNFTFELLEECPRQLLNEKEAFWIEMYQSNKFGYNIQKGIKT